ncbi:S49 family peptidase [Brevundimonas naejangsanensis]|uniref:S49 family peptidase n=1 Tax=Brevundimonas naejangsanensis TaxID=588932 RepID=UPI0034D596C3
MPDYASMAARYAGRPLLLTPAAARDLALRIRSVDPRAFSRPSRLDAFLRRVGLGHAPGDSARTAFAWDDGEGAPFVPIEERLAYQPRWLGEVEDTGFCWSLKDGVALIECDSPLVERGDEFCGVVWHGYDTLLMAMREALADARVRGVFLRLDTPGGVVAGGLPTLARFMREAREAAGGKPIWTYADMACSAGYWIAAQTDRIIAPSVGYVGSIGAVMVHESHAGSLEQDGVEITTIEFPEGGVKTDGAWWKALSESARAAWQADVNQVGELFLADVEAGRSSLTREQLLELRADVFMAEHQDEARSGVALGLADEIMDEEQAFAALVDHVSSEPVSGSQAGASGSRASAHTEKEAVMATKPTAGRQARSAAQVAQAEKALKLAQANLAKVKAGAAAPEPDDEDDKDDVGAGQGGSSAEEKDPDEDDDEDDDPLEASEGGNGEASAIAASAEAKKNPALALAAIQSGQTLAQFKASAAVAGSAQGGNRLDRVMSGAQRLKADGAKAPTGLNAAVAARIDRNRGGVAG